MVVKFRMREADRVQWFELPRFRSRSRSYAQFLDHSITVRTGIFASVSPWGPVLMVAVKDFSG